MTYNVCEDKVAIISTIGITNYKAESTYNEYYKNQKSYDIHFKDFRS